MELAIKATGIELPMPDDGEQPSPEFRTRALVEVSGSLAQSPGRAQLQAEWVCTWSMPGTEEDAPRLPGMGRGGGERICELSKIQSHHLLIISS